LHRLLLVMSCATVAALAAAPMAQADAWPPLSVGAPVWTSLQQASLTAPTPQQSELTGWAVAVDGDTAIVGAPGPTSLSSGSAYVFVRSAGSWTLQATLTPDDGLAGDDFGFSVAVDGDTAVVGASMHSTPRGSFSGSAYVFTRSGISWTQEVELAPDQGRGGDHFGNAVAVDVDTVVVGAIAQDVGSATDAGMAYAFRRTAGVWTQEAKFVLPDAAIADDFGSAVAIDGDTALIGAKDRLLPGHPHAGAAYVYTRTGGSWSLQQMLTSFTPQDSASFGCAVALDGDRALIGARHHEKWTNNGTGAAFSYTRVNGAWSKEHLFLASDGSRADWFGVSVALDDSMALVGAPFHTTYGTAYLFELGSGGWSEVGKLTSPAVTTDEHSARSVGLAGGTAVIGSSAHPVSRLTNAGAAYVFVPDVPPVTNAVVSPALNAAGWTLVTPVTVTLSASAGTTAIERTEYHQATAPVWIVYTEPFTILYPGHYTYEYRSFSVSGLYEMPKTLTIGIGWPDRPPVTTATVSPAPNAHGWNSSPVTVTLTPTYSYTGTATSEYRLSGAADWTAYAVPFKISTRGTWSYEYRSTDLAGVVEDAKSIVVRIGAKPRIAILSPTSGRRGSIVTLKGSAFGKTRGTSYVMFGAKKCTRYVSWSNARVRVRVPAKAAFGRVKVRLVTKVGGSNARRFTVRR
jgi:hypothetical protein